MMRTILGFVTLWLIPGISVGQENPSLPDLAPHVVEITGDLSISFPSLRRQPLVGFNPPPRVPEIPLSRHPFLEIYKQATDDLPPSPLSPPQPPDVSTLANRTPNDGMFEAGVGRYLERYLRAHLSVPVAEQTGLLLSARYLGSDGYEPFSSNPSISSGSDSEHLSAGINHRAGSVLVGGKLGLHRSAFSLFGSEHSSGSALALNPDRTISGWNLSAYLGTRPGSSVAAQLSLGTGRTDVETDLFDAAQQSIRPFLQREGQFSLDGSLRAPINDSHAFFTGNLLIQKLEPDGSEENKISSGQVAGRFRLFPGDGLTLDAGLSILGFDAEGQSRSGEDRSLVFLSPDIRLTYSLRPGTDLVFSNEPELSRSTIRDVYFLAPYIEDNPAIQPVLTPVHLSGKINLYNEFIHATASIGLKAVENFRVIESPPGPFKGFDRGYLSVDYESATVTYLDGSITATLSPGVQANAEIAFRRGRLDRSDSIIPYFSPVTFGGSVALDMFDGRLSLKLLARGESARYRDRNKSEKVGSLLLFDTEGTWYLTDQAGITFGIRNLGGNTEFWDNYEIEPTVVYTGARWRW